MLLIPAYGRTYDTMAQARDDWADGKDFLIIKGPYKGGYCSVRDYAMLKNNTYILWNLIDAIKVK